MNKHWYQCYGTRCRQVATEVHVSALKMKEGKRHLQCFVPGLNPWTARKRKWIVCYQQFNWLYESTSVGKASLSFLISLKNFQVVP